MCVVMLFKIRVKGERVQKQKHQLIHKLVLLLQGGKIGNQDHILHCITMKVKWY